MEEATRQISLNRDDLEDIRAKLRDPAGFGDEQRDFIAYLADRAESALETRDDTVPIWTWTYRF